MTGHRWPALAAAVLCIAAVAPGLARAESRDVVIDGMVFAPATLTVRRGDKVVWRNKDLVPHTATAKGSFDSGNVAPGKSWTHVMKATGSYDYVCTYHPGMKARVVVQ